MNEKTKRKIPFGSLQITDEVKRSVLDCLESGWITSGPRLTQFEQEFAELFGYKHCLAVSSGTDANINCFLALYDFGARRGDEIIVPALSFIATSTAVLAAGFVPVFVDINRETLNIDETKIEEKITSKTRAICAVTTMGKPPKVDIIQDIAKRHNLFFIIDNCEGHGCRYKNRFMHEYCDMTTYSGYAAHLIVSGELGIIGTHRDDIANIIKSTRTHGRENGDLFFKHIRLGYNSKNTDLHASIGLTQIPLFWINFHKRRQNLSRILEYLKQYKDDFYFSEEEPHAINSPHACSITIKPTSNIKLYHLGHYLTQNGIDWKINFRSIPTQQPCMQFLGYNLGDFPEAEYVGNNGLHWGCHADLTSEDLWYIEDVIKVYMELTRFNP